MGIASIGKECEAINAHRRGRIGGIVVHHDTCREGTAFGLNTEVEGTKLILDHLQLARVGIARPISGLALFGIGAAITLFTGRPVWRSGGRQLLLGLAAAGVTFGLGKLIGIAITG